MRKQAGIGTGTRIILGDLDAANFRPQEMRYGRSLYRSDFFEDYLNHRLAEFMPRAVFRAQMVSDIIVRNGERLLVNLGLMRVLFWFHYAMVVHAAVMNWTNCSADSQSEETVEDSSKR